MAAARSFAQGMFLPSLFQGAGASTAVVAAVDSVKPPGSPKGDAMSSVTSIMRRQQCTEQHESLQLCVKAGAKGQDALQNKSCRHFVEAVKYCMLQTQQHNYPVNTAYLV